MIEFDRFWNVYPKRKGSAGKATARLKFLKIVASGVDAEAVINAAKQYAKECEEQKVINTPYVAMAQTWLNQQRWGDYEVKKEAETPFKVFVEVDSPQWLAWSKLRRWPQNDFRVAGRIKRGWYFDAEWPQSRQHEPCREAAE